MRTASEPGETTGCGIRTAVVEAHAIHERPVGDEAEQARPFIARLRHRGDRSHLDVPEAELAESAHCEAVFVEPGGHAERRREALPQGVDRE
jgi:hypothetical protein